MYFDTVRRFLQLKVRCHRAFCAYFLQITDLSSGIDGRALLIVAGFSIRHSHKSLGRTYTMILGAFLAFVEVRRITVRLLEDPSSVAWLEVSDTESSLVWNGYEVGCVF